MEKSILNSNFETNYKYLENGKNTSTMIQQLKLGNDNGKVSYLIDYGTSENQPKEIIKITYFNLTESLMNCNGS